MRGKLFLGLGGLAGLHGLAEQHLDHVRHAAVFLGGHFFDRLDKLVLEPIANLHFHAPYFTASSIVRQEDTTT